MYIYLANCCNMFTSLACSNKDKIAHDFSSPSNSVILVTVLHTSDKLFSVISVEAT